MIALERWKCGRGLCAPIRVATPQRSEHKGPSHVMSFGHPIWLWGLLVLPVLAFFFARAEQVGHGKAAAVCRRAPLPQLAGTVNRGRRIFRFVLLLLVLALVIVSLARPRWGYAFDEVKRKGLDLLLAVDVSRSMLSNDVQPSRLERVKLATQDLINELQGDRVGLIAFAGTRLSASSPHDRLRRRRRFDQRARHEDHPGRRHQHLRRDRARHPDLWQIGNR